MTLAEYLRLFERRLKQRDDTITQLVQGCMMLDSIVISLEQRAQQQSRRIDDLEKSIGFRYSESALKQMGQHHG